MRERVSSGKRNVSPPPKCYHQTAEVTSGRQADLGGSRAIRKTRGHGKKGGHRVKPAGQGLGGGLAQGLSCLECHVEYLLRRFE